MENELAEEVAETSTAPEDAQSSDTPVEEQAVETDENEPGAPSEPESADHDSEAPKSRARDRIEQLNAEKKAALEVAEYWRTQATTSPAEPEPPKDDPRPRLADFDYDNEKWSEAMTDWSDRQIARRAEEVVSKQLTKQKTEAEQQALLDNWRDASAKFAEKHPDFDQVAYNPAVPITKDMFSVMQASDKGPDIAYHLGKHPDKAARIARMSSQSQAMAIGRLEAELSRPAPKPQPSRAPEPPNPVSDSATPSVDPSQMPIEDWMKWRAKELRSKRS